MLSLSPPGIHVAGPGTPALARAVNEHAAKMRSERPTRFGHFASVPMPDVDATIAEIGYALDTLKADGIQLMTSYGERWPGHSDFDPVFAELNRRKALVFIHPLAPQCCGNLIPWVPPVLAEFPQDTTRCVFSLLFSGTLARSPDIRFIFCHAGGSVPILAGRAEVTGLTRMHAKHLPRGMDHELKRLHYDVSGAARQRLSVRHLDRRNQGARSVRPRARRARGDLSRQRRAPAAAPRIDHSSGMPVGLLTGTQVSAFGSQRETTALATSTPRCGTFSKL
jgi:hypothetical protein